MIIKKVIEVVSKKMLLLLKKISDILTHFSYIFFQLFLELLIETICPEIRSPEVIKSVHRQFGRQGPPVDETAASPGIATAVEATEIMTPTGRFDHEDDNDFYFHQRSPPDGFERS